MSFAGSSISDLPLAPSGRIELPTFGLGTWRSIAKLLAESPRFGHLRTVAVALLTAAARGDNVAALEALTQLRVDLVPDFAAGITLASELLDAIVEVQRAAG